MAVYFDDIIGVNIHRVLALATVTYAHGIEFVMADMHGLGLEHIDDLVQHVEHIIINAGQGGAIGVGIGVALPLGEFVVARQQVITVAERGHFRDYINAAFPAVCHDVPHLRLG